MRGNSALLGTIGEMGLVSGGLVAVVAIGWSAGCDRVFGLEPRDASIAGESGQSLSCPSVASGPDEDSDGCADATDNCPGIYNPAQDDGDGDQVGEACDPHPGTPGDAIVSRAMFEGNIIAGGWVPSSAAVWTFANGTAINDADTSLSHSSIGAAGSFPTVEIGFTAITFPELASLRVTMTGATPGSVVCHTDYNAPTFDLFLQAQRGVHTADTTLRMTLRIDPQGSTCTLGQPLSDASTIGAGPSSVTLELRLGLRVALAYIVAYQFVP